MKSHPARPPRIPGQTTAPGKTTVVVVNYNNVTDTEQCVAAARAVESPACGHEVVVVDNGSSDGSYERLRRLADDDVTVVASQVNGGFTGGCNLGVEHATGEFIAFLNNDARPDELWLRAAVDVLQADGSIGCVASKVLDWDGTNIDFVDAACTWYGMGYKPGAGTPDNGTHDQPADVLFATGSAMVVRAELYRSVGGFDERFFMFYEDVDFGWRLNLLGHRVRYVPTSVVFHKHHATMAKFGSYREWFLLERNALMTLYKNASDESLTDRLAPALALSVRRSLAVGEADSSEFDLRRPATGDEFDDQITVSKRALTGPYAVDSFIDQLPSLGDTRRWLQSVRLRSDLEVAPLLRNALEPAIPNERYLAGHAILVEAFGLAKMFAAQAKVLVITGDPLGTKMAGPAIRAWNIALGLCGSNPVRLRSTTACSVTETRFDVASRTVEQMRADVAWADVVIVQGFFLHRAPWLRDSSKVLVIDLYDPMHLEQLEQTRGQDPLLRSRDVASTTAVLNEQLLRGDFFLCASEKQRHFWLGQLAALGRLNPLTYDRDSTLSALVAVVPFGLPDEPATATRRRIKGAVPGIASTDKVLIWAGGIYNWFDPVSLIRAVGALADTRSDLRLFFLGTANPNPHVPAMAMVTKARAISDALGLTDKVVFFNEGWVNYGDRQDYLLDADAGVSTHFQHLETTFSFRTRVLDYLWAGLPLVLTRGDTFADLVDDEGLGVTVPECDVDALVAALDLVLYDDAARERFAANVARVRPQFTWTTALRPLRGFCSAPRRAADAELLARAEPLAASRRFAELFRRDLIIAREAFAAGGLTGVARRARGRVRRQLGIDTRR